MANATSKVRALKGLSLKESVSQFSSTMTAQADLRVECAHLRRFYNNFASVSQSVTPPYPFPGCETAEVLIETFEPGDIASLSLSLSVIQPVLYHSYLLLYCFIHYILHLSYMLSSVLHLASSPPSIICLPYSLCPSLLLPPLQLAVHTCKCSNAERRLHDELEAHIVK